MTTLVNSTITPMADRKWRSLSAALGLLGFLAAGPNAFATWYAEDTKLKVVPLAMVSTSGGPIVFARDSVGNIDSVVNYGGTWYSSPIYPCQPGKNCAATASATYIHPVPNNTLDAYYVAHVDTDGILRLSSFELANIFGGWTTQAIDSGLDPSSATVATVEFQGNLYIFYSRSNGLNDTLRYAIYNGKVTTKTLDGDSTLNGKVAGDMFQPTAVVESVAGSNVLHVYYLDHSHGKLREAFSSDGVKWTYQVIDGQAGFPGCTNDSVGYLPSAIVYNNGMTTTINVFYSDTQVQELRMAQFAWGKWTCAVVDTTEKINDNTTKAPVLYGSEMQVYYISAGGQLRDAYGTGPNAFTLEPLDGQGAGDLTNGHGGVQDPMDPYVTAGTGPSIFYRDNVTDTMRHTYWK